MTTVDLITISRDLYGRPFEAICTDQALEDVVEGISSCPKRGRRTKQSLTSCLGSSNWVPKNNKRATCQGRAERQVASTLIPWPSKHVVQTSAKKEMFFAWWRAHCRDQPGSAPRVGKRVCTHVHLSDPSYGLAAGGGDASARLSSTTGDVRDLDSQARVPSLTGSYRLGNQQPECPEPRTNDRRG